MTTRRIRILYQSGRGVNLLADLLSLVLVLFLAICAWAEPVELNHGFAHPDKLPAGWSVPSAGDFLARIRESHGSTIGHDSQTGEVTVGTSVGPDVEKFAVGNVWNAVTSGIASHKESVEALTESSQGKVNLVSALHGLKTDAWPQFELPASAADVGARIVQRGREILSSNLSVLPVAEPSAIVLGIAAFLAFITYVFRQPRRPVALH